MIIQTNGLTKKYRHQTALNNVTLSIPRGEIYGLIGQNGAGKTTLLKLLTGQINPTEGEIKLFAQSSHSGSHRIGSLIESPGLYPNLSAADNLAYKCTCLGLHDKAHVKRLLTMVGLTQAGKKPVKHFSMGMKQRLGIALAMAGNPDLLLLDEPINGMDPQGIVEFRQLFRQLNQDHGITIVISSHMLDELSRSASSFGILKDGQLINQFSKQQLDEQTSDHIEIISPHVTAAAALLEDKLNLTDYRIVDRDTLLLHQGLEQAKDIARMLFDHDIFVESYHLKKTSLEDYFLQLTGDRHA